MRPSRSRRSIAFLVLLLLVPLQLIVPRPAAAFTQSGFGTAIGNGIPMGHEWITRLAAIEVLGYSREVPDVPDPNDPRRHWTQGLARNPDVSGAGEEVRRIKGASWNDERYLSRYKAVYDAIVGQRWVDLGGYNAATSKDCWDAVAQEAVDVQFDHFMRRWNDFDGQGGVVSAHDARQRFVDYFVAAATAPPTQIAVYDGGVALSTSVTVDRNYFLFGRAVHLFQDSFSSEHTVRIPEDNHVRVRQVKSYMCAAGSEQHTHSTRRILDYTSGDVVWIPGTQIDVGWRAYKPSSMKPTALVATEASKDLWAAFIRTMAKPMAERAAAARSEAVTLATNWLGSDDQEVRTWYDDPSHRGDTFLRPTNEEGSAEDVKRCMAGLDVGTDDPAVRAAQLQETRRTCLYNALPWPGYSDLYDTSMRLWYSWQWRNKLKLEPAPPGWQVPDLPADSGTRVRVRSVANGHSMSAPDGIRPDAWVYCRAGAAPLDFIFVGPQDDGVFRLVDDPDLFLSYRLTTGAVKLYRPTALETPTNYRIERLPNGPPGSWSIWNRYWKQYMWLSGESPYITRQGDPKEPSGQWILEGMP